MGAFTSVALVTELDHGTNSKECIISAICPASYDASGSTIDLSTWFTQVYSVRIAGRAIGGAVAGAGYSANYIPATAYAAATGKIVMGLTWQATPAEASGDLSTTPGTLLLRVVGR